jgi:hypothetical protein
MRCDKNSEQKYLSISIAKATARYAKYWNVSPRTIQRTRNESNNCVLNGGLSTPREKWICPKVRNTETDDLLKILFTTKDNTGLQEAYPFVKVLNDWKATTLG